MQLVRCLLPASMFCSSVNHCNPSTIRAQIGWCQKEKISQALFTHCGSQIVKGDGRTLGAKVRALGKERGVQAGIAL